MSEGRWSSAMSNRSALIVGIAWGANLLCLAIPLVRAQPVAPDGRHANERGGAAPLESVTSRTAADEGQWTWSDERANPFYSLSESDTPYDVVMVSGPRDRVALTFKLVDGKREVYSWKGHRYSVFRVLGDRLYYAQFPLGAPGG